MNEWWVYSSPGGVNWTQHPLPFRPAYFKLAKGNASAAEVFEREGKFYWYITMTNDDVRPGKAIGAAVVDITIEGVVPAK